jgi:hypothetical protein
MSIQFLSKHDMASIERKVARMSSEERKAYAMVEGEVATKLQAKLQAKLTERDYEWAHSSDVHFLIEYGQYVVAAVAEAEAKAAHEDWANRWEAWWDSEKPQEAMPLS